MYLRHEVGQDGISDGLQAGAAGAEDALHSRLA
jgi:hypothetical protein